MTVTLKVPVDVLFERSFAVHVTVVAPTGNTAPEAGVQVTGRIPLTASSALVTNVTVAPAGPVAAAVMSAGSVRTGAVASATVRAIAQVPLLPLGSAANTFTFRVPRASAVPTVTDCDTVTVPDRSLAATALARFGNASVAAPAGTASVSVAGHTLNTGGVVSRTVTLTERLALLPAASLATKVCDEVVGPAPDIGKVVTPATGLLIDTTPDPALPPTSAGSVAVA